MHMESDIQTLSLMLSKVMDNIGVNSRIVSMRRRTALMAETVKNLNYELHGIKLTAHIFGSSSEGTTTPELKPDLDVLSYDRLYNVITSMDEWEPNVNNLLMIQGNDVAPGYCMLQVLREDAPLPVTGVLDEHEVKDSHGRVMLKNSFIHSMVPEHFELHGPSFKSKSCGTGDLIYAFPCKSLPGSVKQWLDQPTHAKWPTHTLINSIKNSICYVVAVGCKGSPKEDMEWRISTSEAERCLMFSLNITQIRTYVLMKMLVKCKINHYVPEKSSVSSFMCKTVLFHCIESSNLDKWQSQNLLTCLWDCLSELRSCIIQENCPHFLIHTNNLMVRRFTNESKCQLLENVQAILKNPVRDGIFSIYIDDVSERMRCKLLNIQYRVVKNYLLFDIISAILAGEIAIWRQTSVFTFLFYPGLQNVGYEIKVKRLKEYIEYLKQLKSKGNNLKRSACAYLLPVYFTLLGSVQASHSMQISQSVSPSAIVHLSLGLNSDVASGRLKLASVYYCTDNIESCEVLLKDIERRYDFNVCFPACVCYAFERKSVPIGITQTYIECRDEQDIESTACFCVIYMPNELVPKELYFELFRSTRNELSIMEEMRIELPLTRRMNWGVVDSITYLYFLQYKVNSRLQRPQGQKRALNNLALYIDKEHHLGHRETALNLLGQCMEQENRHKTAFKCYWLSLKVRSANNAARVHICRLLNNILNTLSTSK